MQRGGSSHTPGGRPLHILSAHRVTVVASPIKRQPEVIKRWPHLMMSSGVLLGHRQAKSASNIAARMPLQSVSWYCIMCSSQACSTHQGRTGHAKSANSTPTATLSRSCWFKPEGPGRGLASAKALKSNHSYDESYLMYLVRSMHRQQTHQAVLPQHSWHHCHSSPCSCRGWHALVL